MNSHDSTSGTPVVALCDAAAGDVVAAVSHTLTRDDLRAYAEASGDHNPIHLDEEFARGVGLSDVIAHGMLTMGLVGGVIEGLAGAATVREFGARFAAPVVVPADGGANIDVVVTVLSRSQDGTELALDAAVSVAGTKVLSRTRAVIQLD